MVVASVAVLDVCLNGTHTMHAHSFVSMCAGKTRKKFCVLEGYVIVFTNTNYFHSNFYDFVLQNKTISFLQNYNLAITFMIERDCEMFILLIIIIRKVSTIKLYSTTP